MKNDRIVLFITGPVASGKNEVAKILRAKGFLIIDADKIGHEILKKKKNSIKKAFGAGIVNNGKIDRKALRKAAFGNKISLKKLNAIVHPDLIKAIKDKIRAAKHKKIAINAALYKELCFAHPDADVVSVLASRRSRTQRLLLTRKMTLKEVRSLISVQQKDSYYKKIADTVILNDSSLEDLKEQVNYKLAHNL
ncbi:MAG: dephospho-CoA kinase [Candidatus Margulisiibacteriota bacterium]